MTNSVVKNSCDASTTISTGIINPGQTKTLNFATDGNYTIDIAYDKLDAGTVTSLKILTDTIAKHLRSINDLLDNFKNKKFNGDIKSFVNGIETTEFFKGNTTVQEYNLFNYNRDSILKPFSETISKIVGERTGPTRDYLGKSIRGKFSDFFKTFLTFNLIEKIGIQQHYLKELTAGYENEFKIRLNELYQAPADGKTYLHLRLFSSDEDAEDYDCPSCYDYHFHVRPPF
jgi:hypothetical protein